jgi:hypothetical protein
MEKKKQLYPYVIMSYLDGDDSGNEHDCQDKEEEDDGIDGQEEIVIVLICSGLSLMHTLVDCSIA